ncbi:T-even-induced deoxynucleotide kinase [Shewanella phage vB_SbaS_Y11]|nr:T-even-induced deoxynucleotide kinase [Shewanella phage vB_SbaS_Y11]
MSKPTEFVRCNSCNNAYHRNSHNGICIKSVSKCEHCQIIPDSEWVKINSKNDVVYRVCNIRGGWVMLQEKGDTTGKTTGDFLGVFPLVYKPAPAEDAEPSKPTTKRDRLKKLSEPAQRRLDEYVDSLPAHEQQPVIDDTFNDDTPAQTFGGIQWDMGTQDRAEEVVVIPCPKCKKAVPYDKHGAFFLIGNMAVCTNCYVNKNKMRLIGIAGPARAGKDTLASYLLEHLTDDWSRSSFADPIKEMLRAVGVHCSDDAKAVVSDDYGVTPRHMMQTLGTDWGRQMIGEDIWVKAFARINAGKQVVVPDVRFENEADLVRANGILIHLVGRGGIEGDHVSENKLPFKEGDIVIDNSRGIDWLYAQVKSHRRLLEVIFE